MPQQTTKGPPPMPDPVGSGIDSLKVVLVMSATSLLLTVLLIALISSKPQVAGVGGGGTGATGNESGSTQDSANEGETGEGSQTGAGAGSDFELEPEQAEATPSEGSDSEAGPRGQNSASSEATLNEVAGNDASAAGDPLPPGISIEVPKSDRKVRNTFNPFGGTAPPKKAAPKATKPGEPGKSAEFFGVGAEGKSFVYVVDKSSSMMMGKKFEAARQELIESIKDFRPNQAFFVIFFDSVSHPQEPMAL